MSLPLAKRRKLRLLKNWALFSSVVVLALFAGSTVENGLKPWSNPFISSALAFQQLTASETVRQKAIWLPDFQVVIDAKKITGIKDDLSGLTYDPDRRSLFAVTNKHSEIIELSLTGEVLRRIPLRGADDPEAIEYIAPGRYVIAEERKQKLIALTIHDDTTELDVQHEHGLAIAIGRNGNLGFEGLAYDRAGDRLFVAKERDPLQIYTITGFSFAATGAAHSTALQIHDLPAYTKALPLRDLSSLYFHAPTGHLLALSDESRLIVELDKTGKAISKMSLRAGKHGLQRKIPQAEGLAMDDEGNLYVVSEPNLFYKFSANKVSANKR